VSGQGDAAAASFPLAHFLSLPWTLSVQTWMTPLALQPSRIPGQTWRHFAQLCWRLLASQPWPFSELPTFIRRKRKKEKRKKNHQVIEQTLFSPH